MELNHVQRGRLGEEDAGRFLHACGMTVLQSNFAWKGGEIDLIARDGATLVFVEIKWRKNLQKGSPASAVGRLKQQSILQTAMVWMKRNGYRTGGQPIRFDVLASVGTPCQWQWFKGAFGA